MDETQKLIVAYPCVAQHLADLELGVALSHVLKPRQGLQMVGAIGGDEGTAQRPAGEEPVIHPVERLALVAEGVLAFGSRTVVRRSVLCLRLMGAAVVDIGGVGIAGGGVAAVIATGGGIAGTPGMVAGLSRARPLVHGPEAARILVVTAHLGAGRHQLAVDGPADAVIRGISGEGAVGGDDLVGQQGRDQALSALAEDLLRCPLQRRTEGRLTEHIVRIKAQAAAVAAWASVPGEQSRTRARIRARPTLSGSKGGGPR